LVFFKRRLQTPVAVSLAALILGATLTPVTTLTAKVIHVDDGDSIAVLVDQKRIEVRLEGIDCPERGQAFGDQARQFTRELILGKYVRVEERGKDRYGRTLGRVEVGSTDVNLELVKAGLAWFFRRYSNDQALATAEREASAAHRGLWADSHPIPPWDWRAGEHPGVPSTSPSATDEAYRGNAGSMVFHRPGCLYYRCHSCTRLFATREAALAAGFKPCGLCRP
jgi:endonuclease YncB( thermonuclease family)